MLHLHWLETCCAVSFYCKSDLFQTTSSEQLQELLSNERQKEITSHMAQSSYFILLCSSVEKAYIFVIRGERRTVCLSCQSPRRKQHNNLTSQIQQVTSNLQLQGRNAVSHTREPETNRQLRCGCEPRDFRHGFNFQTLPSPYIYRLSCLPAD